MEQYMVANLQKLPLIRRKIKRYLVEHSILVLPSLSREKTYLEIGQTVCCKFFFVLGSSLFPHRFVSLSEPRSLQVWLLINMRIITFNAPLSEKQTSVVRVFCLNTDTWERDIGFSRSCFFVVGQRWDATHATDSKEWEKMWNRIEIFFKRLESFGR